MRVYMYASLCVYIRTLKIEHFEYLINALQVLLQLLLLLILRLLLSLLLLLLLSKLLSIATMNNCVNGKDFLKLRHVRAEDVQKQNV